MLRGAGVEDVCKLLLQGIGGLDLVPPLIRILLEVRHPAPASPEEDF
jgi:hypothetical protein